MFGRTRVMKMLLALGMILLGTGLLSCASEHEIAMNMLKKNPRHKNNIPEKPACPIDGLWQNAASASTMYIIEKGRLYLTAPMMVEGHNMDWPMVVIRDIERVGPGKYRGRMIEKSLAGTPCTLSVVDPDTLVCKMHGRIAGIYLKKRVYDKEWFAKDYNMIGRRPSGPKAKGKGVSSGKPSVQSKSDKLLLAPILNIKSVSLQPAQVLPGHRMDLVVVFITCDLGARDPYIPVHCHYSISNKQGVLFRSKPSIIKCENVAKIKKVIHLLSSRVEGDYRIDVVLEYKGLKRKGSCLFRIQKTIDPSARTMAREDGSHKRLPPEAQNVTIKDRLLGEWEYVFPQSKYAHPRLILSKHNNKLVAQVLRKGTKTHWLRLKLNEHTLVLRYKQSRLGKDCWFMVEDVIIFNDEMDKMPVITKIIDGSRCVQVGRMSKSRLYRIK